MEQEKNDDPYGRESLTVGKYYPLAPGESILPSGYTKSTTRVKATGEYRLPKQGEWFLSGAVIEGYLAVCDMATPMHIGVLVKGEIVSRWIPLPDEGIDPVSGWQQD